MKHFVHLFSVFTADAEKTESHVSGCAMFDGIPAIAQYIFTKQDKKHMDMLP